MKESTKTVIVAVMMTALTFAIMVWGAGVFAGCPGRMGC